MPDTARYGLHLLQAGQAQKEVTHNEALARVDALLHLVVDSRRQTTRVGVEGAAWIVAPGATGDWLNHAGQIAAFDASGWSFVAPRDGCIAFVRDEAVFIHYHGGSWRDGWPVPRLVLNGQTLTGGGLVSVPAASGGSVVDVEARAALNALLAVVRAMGILDA